MYNGRQRHIQTESIQDQSAKESVHGHRNGESALRHVKNKVPSNKSKTLGRKRNVQGAKQLLLITKRKTKSSIQCYIWFHGCKLDCIHVTIAYAIR